MKTTLKEVIAKNNTLQEISEKKLPVRIGYAVSKNLAKIQAECELIEKERIKLIENYAEKDSDGTPIITNGNYELGESRKAFSEEFADYLDTEIEVDIHQIPLSELDKLEETRYDALTPAELAALEFIFLAE